MGSSAKQAESQNIDAILQYMEKLPYQARLDYFMLTHAERSLIRAMCSCSPPKGFTVWLDIEDLGIRANLSRKQVQRLIHGWTDQRNGNQHHGLKARGIVTEVAKANRGRRRPATYRVNWDAFSLDPQLIGVLERRMQLTLPGIKRPAVPGEEIQESSSPVTAPGDMRHGDACSAKPPLLPQAQLANAAQQSLSLPRPSVHAGSPGRESLAGVEASGTSVTVSQHMRHRDPEDASPCRSTCVTVTPIVLDSSFESSNEFKNRSSGHQQSQLKQFPAPPQKALVKTGWEKLPPGLRAKLTNEIRMIRESQVGSHFLDDRTPEEIAGELRHLVLVASERAGIWPHIAQQIANEWYQERLQEEREKITGGYDA